MSVKEKLKLLLPKYQKLILDYRVEFKPRYGYGLKPHKLLYDIVNANREQYVSFINDILINKSIFHAIKPSAIETNENEPAWNNGFFPGLDVVSLYTMIKKHSPKNTLK